MEDDKSAIENFLRNEYTAHIVESPTLEAYDWFHDYEGTNFYRKSDFNWLRVRSVERLRWVVEARKSLQDPTEIYIKIGFNSKESAQSYLRELLNDGGW